jgi:type 1 fimbriae regulatory protein FimB/type 1 fimbriae regulatory protein FimE
MKVSKGKTSKSAKKEVKNLPPSKPKNKDVRAREYLTESEVEKLRKSARKYSRYGHRDDTLILMMFRHAFRVSEVVALRWDQIDLKKGLLHVSRIKNGLASKHPLRGV